MIDCALSTSETFQSRSRKKLSPGSLVAMERFCPSVIASSMSTLMSAMVTGWPKYYWIMTFRSLLKSMDATVALGIHVNRLSVLYAESLAIVPRPAHSLVFAGAVTSPAIWPGSAHRLGALPLLCRVTTIRWMLKKILMPVLPILFLVLPSVTLPAVTSPPVISTSPVTAVCSTVATPTSRPTVAVTTPVNVSTGSTTAASVSAPLASVSTASTVSTASASKSSSSDVSAPSSKKPRTVISREIFLRCLAKLYPTVELPSFDNAKGKEWDTRAKAYIRQQVKIVFQDKRIGITKSDLATWDLEDVGWLRHDLCNILSIRN